MTCFSKPYDNDPNPKSAFGAVMVCTDADEACPFVPGAEFRLAVPFVDPKVSDNTPEEAATYDERCAQIAREMLYAMTVAAR
jgi:arsenate reductase